MSRLTRDGTAEPVSRDQILRRERGQGNINFPAQLTTCRIGNLTRLIHTLAMCVTIHNTYNMQAPVNHTCLFIFSFVYLEMSLFQSIFGTIAAFSL